MKLVILGAGGHGKTIADIATQLGCYDEIIFLDDNNKNASGKCQDFLKYKADDTYMYPAFGNNEARLNWENKFEENGINLATIIHPSAYISPTVTIAAGSVVLPKAVISTNAKIGKACIINLGAIIDHDVEICDGCHIAPGGVVKGDNYLPPKTKVESGEVIERGTMPRK